jgi:hypothetical protein
MNNRMNPMKGGKFKMEINAEINGKRRMNPIHGDEFTEEITLGINNENGRTPERKNGLKNGNPSGDLSKVLRCGSRTRRQTACNAPAMANGRCRMHGGPSTGPRTESGLQRSRRANWKHGWCSQIAAVIRWGDIRKYPHLYKRYFPKISRRRRTPKATLNRDA